MKVSTAQIDHVLSQIQISDVIGQHVAWDKKKTNITIGDYWACCPFHGEKTPSFHCENQKGRYYCFGCDASGNAINFLRELRGLSFIDAYRQLGGETREPTPEKRQAWAEKQRQLEGEKKAKARQAESDVQARIVDVRSLWRSCVPYEGTLAGQYLAHRGYGDLGPMPTLRFHGALFCDLDRKQHPCLVAAVQNVGREITAVWRIFLTPQGGNLKIDGVKVKRGLGPASGGFVRFGPVGLYINFGEGLESTLGAMFLNQHEGAWGATLSTSGIRGLIIPSTVRKVNFWSDGDRYRINGNTGEICDPPGQGAARARHKQALSQGLQSQVVEPPEGSDWDDVWNGGK